MLNMTPLGAGSLRRFQVPEDWEQQQGTDCLTGHACSCQPTKAQIRGALKHGWRVLAMVGSTWCGNLMLIIMACTTIPFGAVMDIGFGSFLYSATVAWNIHVLPWNDGAFGRKIIQAADTLRKFSSSSHPVFQRTRDCIRQLRTHCLESVSDVRVFPHEWAESWHVQVVSSVRVFAKAF